jgi:tRNA uracil 4-sulfurtransferase
MYTNVIIHYDEIGLKGKNRFLFEDLLVKNLKKALGKNVSKTYKKYGKIVCDLSEKYNKEKVEEMLLKAPGVANFSLCFKTTLDIKEIENKALELTLEKEFKSFRIQTKRSNKSYDLNSPEINKRIAEFIFPKLKNPKVNLTNPDFTLYIEIGEKEAFVFTEKYNGIGGLPTSSVGKLVSSLSGGIDSPVASYMMIKRGCEVVFTHIQNKNISQSAVLNKIETLVEQLTKFQLSSKLYIIPFEKIQKQIITFVPSKYRMVVYRRFMMQIINEIAKKEKAKGIVTGDSLGQVASQTLDNLSCIQDASKLPIFSPLIGLNKVEIIALARKIETYEHSILPYDDCCSFMVAKHPETKARLRDIKKAETNIEDKEELIADAVDRSEIKTFEIKN